MSGLNYNKLSSVLCELQIILVDGVVEAGAVAAALVEDVYVCALLHEEPGNIHVALGQGVVQSGEGCVVRGAVNISPGI